LPMTLASLTSPATTEIYTLSLHDALPIFGDLVGHLADIGDDRDDLFERDFGRFGLAGGAARMLDLGTHRLDRLPRCLLQPFDQLLNLGGRTAGAPSQRAHLVGHHGEAAAMVARPTGLDGRGQGEEVGLFGNRANHRQYSADGAGFVRQALDGLGIDFDLADQRLQTLEALTDDLLAVADRLFGGAAGFGGFLRTIGDLLDGALQRAQGVRSEERRVGTERRAGRRPC